MNIHSIVNIFCVSEYTFYPNLTATASTRKCIALYKKVHNKILFKVDICSFINTCYICNLKELKCKFISS